METRLALAGGFQQVSMASLSTAKLRPRFDLNRPAAAPGGARYHSYERKNGKYVP